MLPALPRSVSAHFDHAASGHLTCVIAVRTGRFYGFVRGSVRRAT